MALPDFVTPTIAVVGTPALAYVAARSLWHFARALVVVVASFAAIKTSDKDRREAALKVVSTLTGENEPWYRAILPPWRKPDDEP